MITSEIKLYDNANSLIAEGSKLILFAQIIDERFSFQYDLKLFGNEVIDYIKATPVSSPIDPKGGRIKGKNYQSLTNAEIQYIVRKAAASGLCDTGIKQLTWGIFARYIYKYVINDLRQNFGKFNILEHTFEKFLSDKTAEVTKGNIIDAIQLTNNTETEQSYTIVCGDYSVTGNTPVGLSEIEINHYCKDDETLTITTECQAKTLIKADDMSCYVPLFVSGTNVSDITGTGATVEAEIYSMSNYLDVVSSGFYYCLKSENILSDGVYVEAELTEGVYSVILESLLPLTEYQVKFKTINSLGEEAESAITPFTTI